MKIFIDANVLFTAAYSPTGKASTLLTTLNSLIITSDYAAEEAHRNISIKKPDAIKILDDLMKKIKVVPSVYNGSCSIKLPTKDQPIFITALRVKATHLLTGDIKDFGPHMNNPKKSEGIIIQTVSMFLSGL